MKQRGSKPEAKKITAHIVHVYFEYVCFMFAARMLPGVNGVLETEFS